MVAETGKHGHTCLVKDLARLQDELFHVWPHVQVVVDVVIGEGRLPKLWLIARAAERVATLVRRQVQRVGLHANVCHF